MSSIDDVLNGFGLNDQASNVRFDPGVVATQVDVVGTPVSWPLLFIAFLALIWAALEASKRFRL